MDLKIFTDWKTAKREFIKAKARVPIMIREFVKSPQIYSFKQ